MEKFEFVDKNTQFQYGDEIRFSKGKEGVYAIYIVQIGYEIRHEVRNSNQLYLERYPIDKYPNLIITIEQMIEAKCEYRVR